MKILAIVSSYRKKGNTAQVVRLIEERMRHLAARKYEALRFDTLYLGQYDVQMCRGCRVCFDKGEDKCPLRDDLLAIKTKMSTADGVIFASPVYVGDVNGAMKNLIDRLAHVCHRPEFAGNCI
jgi:multimeric flavodoxin WrbA